MATLTKAPFSSARITLIDGDQGNGKSVTAVARIYDAYSIDAVSIYCREQLKITCEVKSYSRTYGVEGMQGVARIKYKGELKLLRIPSKYKLNSPMRIFTNFHLYGIPYVYCQTFNQILEWLKSGLICDGILAIDEYYIGANARESLGLLGRSLSKQSFQFRKMQLEVMILTPLARVIDWTARMINTERISCLDYNPKTKRVTIEIKKKGQVGSRVITYDASPYFCNYRTNERINA